MGKKRKHSEQITADANKDESVPERPKRTLLGWKDEGEPEKESVSVVTWKNKEKVLITFSRRISYMLLFLGVYYWCLMLNLVSLLPHCKKDNKVESKSSKGATLNELVELKSCSSCLFFEISFPHSGAQKLDGGDLEKMTLVEVGPWFCLNPIKIFGGSFGGSTLYENPFYVSPNQVRSLEKKQKAGRYAKKVKAKTFKRSEES
ncbi:PREDICTED: ribosome biogenesis protein BRX1 homolog [Ipomoea nil]|uniref:ribosome biogenesis protein BRX1 homolog n=1 Tax=Ipomoea nil TaxID=35883 RepID=UPI0009019807|nr:PREDICTED: ribosome biogenesis protein BRX1 homolog [Ipomoea nil]